MRTSILALVGMVLAVGGLGTDVAPSWAQDRQAPLVDQVKKSIDKGIKFLREQQQGGNWEVNLQGAVAVEGGWSALALLALLNAGVEPQDPRIQAGLKYLRGLEPKMTYVRALQTMAYAEAGLVEDRQRIVENVKWLIKSSVLKDGKYTGHTYEMGMRREPDGSNTQYAILGLLAGKNGGAEIKREVWQGIRDFYVRTQLGDGTWKYSSQGLASGSPLTMTEAGVCGLLVAAMELNSGREIDDGQGGFKNCGVYGEDEELKKGLSWIGRPGNFQIGTLLQANFYNIYGIERVGRLSGQRFIGDYDWYREGCQWLVKNQKDNGSWQGSGAWDNWPTVSTSFALLFLSKGRTPVLISKLVHGKREARSDLPEDSDWNNDRNDLRNLTDFASKKVFVTKERGPLPLAWQSFDIARALRRGKTEADIADAASELLPSPIVYFNGHKSPLGRFSTQEQEVLKKYLENGGFILAEACCGRPEFDRGFRQLVEKMWPDAELKPLDGNHPIYRAFPKLPVNLKRSPPKLWGINRGCKTVLVYSPVDLSCRWESNRLDDPLVEDAFNLGANIIAYATGLEPPAPRGTKVPVGAGDDRKGQPNPRGFYKVGQLRHNGDPKVAPRAMRNLMERLNTIADLDVSLETEFDLSFYEKETVNYKFLYMHGRNAFDFEEGEALKSLRFNLENGGLLFADACCGSPTFDKAFRRFMAELFPENLYPKDKFPGAKLQPIPPNDELFSAKLNGTALTEQNIRCRTAKSGPLQPTAPQLEGVKIGNRWVVIYSRWDIGCALEKHQASDCLGYDVESAFKIAGAAVLYTLRP